MDITEAKDIFAHVGELIDHRDRQSPSEAVYPVQFTMGPEYARRFRQAIRVLVANPTPPESGL